MNQIHVLPTERFCPTPLISFPPGKSQQYNAKIGKQLTLWSSAVLLDNPRRQIFSILYNGIDTFLSWTPIFSSFSSAKDVPGI